MTWELLIALFGHRTWSYGGSTGRLSSARDYVGKSEALVELNLARDIKDDKKSFYRNVSDKGKSWENVGTLQKETDLVTWDREGAEATKLFWNQRTSLEVLTVLQLAEQGLVITELMRHGCGVVPCLRRCKGGPSP